MWYAITHPSDIFKGSLAKLLLKLGQWDAIPEKIPTEHMT